MRLEKLDRGHRFPQKAQLAVMRLLMRGDAPDVVKTLLYRPELAGKRFNALTHAVMRGPSEWSVGERELMAAFVSKLNQCVF
jgi:alkylhydroperoxidase family enzyme